MDFFGLRYQGNLNNFIDWSVYFYGAYEKANLALLRDLARSQGGRCTFVDVGSNVGQHSLWMSQYCQEVHAFEPWIAVRRRLEEKLAINRVRNIAVHGVALGEKHEKLPFYAPTGTNLGSGSFLATHSPTQNRLLSDRLEVVRGDDYFRQHGICPSLIKIDVEGFEPQVLWGMRDTIAELSPTILIEFSTTTQAGFASNKELRKLLTETYFINFVIDRGSWRYRLGPFSFDRPSYGDVLLSPRKRLG